MLKRYIKIVDNGKLEVADSHNTHSRLDTRTSRYTTLVNKESLYRLSSIDGRRWQLMVDG
jgi:hypothetical protein